MIRDVDVRLGCIFSRETQNRTHIVRSSLVITLGSYSIFNSLNFALNNGHTLTWSGDVEHNTNLRKLITHRCQSTFAIGSYLHAVEVSHISVVDK